LMKEHTIAFDDITVAREDKLTPRIGRLHHASSGNRDPFELAAFVG
jgi:hypothetical protein